ncbi:MAG: tripartite tricarboxylate transporter TctB family protein [Granulosicoccus sp.]
MSAPATTTRAQHLVPASIILALALSVAYLSFTREPAAAFLFPRFIGSVMLLLALWNFLRAVLGMARIGDGLSAHVVRNLLPGVVLMSVFALFAAKYFGFYVASWVAFFSVFSLYDPASHLAVASWVKRVLITTLFMSVIYCLFTLLLKVQTPRGLFF